MMTFIYGIDDDVLLVFAFISFVIAAMSVSSQQRTQPARIHPMQNAQVLSARRSLSFDERQLPSAEPPPLTPPPVDTSRPATRAAPGDNCPICISPLQFHCETNCGHSFCASCIKAYSEHSQGISAMTCPCCRQQVTLILKSFSLADDRSPQCLEWSQWIDRYNRRFSGAARSWSEYLTDAPTLLRHLFRDLWSGTGLMLMFRLRVVMLVVVCAAYMLSPLDLIPEALLGAIGFIDDLIILLIILIYMSVLYRSVIASR
eukprot:Opistho-2@18359